MKITLQYPIKTKAGEVSELDIRRMRGADMVKNDEWMKKGLGAGETTLLLVSMLAGISYDEAQELDVDDIMEIQEKVFPSKMKETGGG